MNEDEPPFVVVRRSLYKGLANRVYETEEIVLLSASDTFML